MNIERSEDRPYHSPVKRLKNLRQGQTLYKVYALGEGSFIETILVMSRPKIHSTITTFTSGESSTNDYIFIDHKMYSTSFSKSFVVQTSLEDAGIIPNTHNHHRTFTSKKKAMRYLELCKQEVVKKFESNYPFYNDDSDFGWWFLDEPLHPEDFE